jgi:hypothetical protein
MKLVTEIYRQTKVSVDKKYKETTDRWQIHKDVEKPKLPGVLARIRVLLVCQSLPHIYIGALETLPSAHILISSLRS